MFFTITQTIQATTIYASETSNGLEIGPVKNTVEQPTSTSLSFSELTKRLLDSFSNPFSLPMRHRRSVYKGINSNNTSCKKIPPSTPNYIIGSKGIEYKEHLPQTKEVNPCDESLNSSEKNSSSKISSNTSPTNNSLNESSGKLTSGPSQELETSVVEKDLYIPSQTLFQETNDNVMDSKIADGSQNYLISPERSVHEDTVDESIPTSNCPELRDSNGRQLVSTDKKSSIDAKRTASSSSGSSSDDTTFSPESTSPAQNPIVTEDAKSTTNVAREPSALNCRIQSNPRPESLHTSSGNLTFADMEDSPTTNSVTSSEGDQPTNKNKFQKVLILIQKWFQTTWNSLKNLFTQKNQ